MNNKRILLSYPHMSGREEPYVHQAFQSNWVAPLGPFVDRFEREIASRIGVAQAAATNSGTGAIHIALRLLGIQPNDIVFCSSLTFIASANPIVYEKAIPVFIDADPSTWNMSPVALKKAFETYAKKGERPKAVIAVELYGLSPDLDAIASLCREYKVPLIEDAAEALGSTYKGRACGSFGDFGILSFNGNKIITTSGGGMLVSNNEAAIQKARFLITQARDPAPHYQHSELGFNYRLSNILAAIGVGQLEVLDERVERRREIFHRYQEKLDGIAGLSFMPSPSDQFANHWLSCIRIDPTRSTKSNMDLYAILNADNIESRPIWKPLHLQPLFKDSDFFAHDQDVSSDIFLQGLCLPSSSNHTNDDIDRVIHAIQKALV